jgi:glutaredoxin
MLLHTLEYDYRMYYLNVDYTLTQLQRLIPDVKTVPQIYHGTKYIGGLKELHEFLQKSEGLSNGSISGLDRAEGLFSRSSEDKSNNSGIHKEQ